MVHRSSISQEGVRIGMGDNTSECIAVAIAGDNRFPAYTLTGRVGEISFSTDLYRQASAL